MDKSKNSEESKYVTLDTDLIKMHQAYELRFKIDKQKEKTQKHKLKSKCK